MLETIIEVIGTYGFPIACVLAMGAFIFYIYKDTTKQNAANMSAVQARCKEREEVLFNELRENRAVNAKAIETIAHYDEKLNAIQQDVKEIKTDLTIIMAKE